MTQPPDTGTCPTCNHSPISRRMIACPQCGARLPWADSSTPSPTPAPTALTPLGNRPSSSNVSALQSLGALLIVGAGLVVAYYFLVFDTSVAVPTFEFMGTSYGGGRVNNIGLMAERQNGIMIGIGVMIVGAILFAIGQTKKSSG